MKVTEHHYTLLQILPATGELRYRYPCWSSNENARIPERLSSSLPPSLIWGDEGLVRDSPRASVHTLVQSQQLTTKACDSSSAPEPAFPNTRPWRTMGNRIFAGSF